MKITNKLNLPEPVIEAIKNSGYTKGNSDFTATGIIEPIQIQILKKRFEADLEEDASNLLYSLQGQSIHTILERAAASLAEKGNNDYVFEKRFYLEIEDKILSAQIDLFQISKGLIQDYKVTSVYQIKNDLKEEWVKQTNIQAYLMKQGYELVKGKKIYHNYIVNDIQIIAILRDWSKSAVTREDNYPLNQLAVIDIPFIPESEVLFYLQEQIKQLKKVDNKPATELPPCSKEERWAKDDVYAVMKIGQKKATKLCYSEEAAKMYIDTLGGKGYNIILRPGKNTRCELYCPVKHFCFQFKLLKEIETKNQGESNE